PVTSNVTRQAPGRTPHGAGGGASGTTRAPAPVRRPSAEDPAPRTPALRAPGATRRSGRGGARRPHPAGRAARPRPRRRPGRASRAAVAAARARLGAAASDRAVAATVGAELFAVVGLLDQERARRRALADSTAARSARTGLVRDLFAGRVSPATLDLLTVLAG